MRIHDITPAWYYGPRENLPPSTRVESYPSLELFHVLIIFFSSFHENRAPFASYNPCPYDSYAFLTLVFHAYILLRWLNFPCVMNQ